MLFSIPNITITLRNEKRKKANFKNSQSLQLSPFMSQTSQKAFINFLVKINYENASAKNRNFNQRTLAIKRFLRMQRKESQEQNQKSAEIQILI